MSAVSFGKSRLEMTLPAFLRKFQIPASKFHQTGLKWSDLKEIYADYVPKIPELELAADGVAGMLGRAPRVHAVRSRVKDSEHVVAKVIRKSIEDSVIWATPESYFSKLTDAIGVRALLVFDDHIPDVDRYIRSKWKCTDPVAFVHHGDPRYLIDMLKGVGCRIKEVSSGYRSLHYDLIISPQSVPFRVEAQVRTLFEEARSESDHAVRYPHNMDDREIGRLVNYLSRLAHQCDHLNSALHDLAEIRRLKRFLSKHAIDDSRRIGARFRDKISEYRKRHPESLDGRG